jgi:signal transduction histidine kinase
MSLRLQVALANVLDNSLKYTQAAWRCEVLGGIEEGQTGPAVKVAFQEVTTDGASGEIVSGIAIVISDNGAGFDPLELADVFTRGFRGKPLSNVHSWPPGNGLGLTDAQNLMQSMGGDVLAENARQKSGGARVILLLPVPEDIASES